MCQNPWSSLLISILTADFRAQLIASFYGIVAWTQLELQVDAEDLPVAR
jgi:hypothetical protein